MNDAFQNQTPVIAEESEKGDGWHLYNSRGDRIAVILGDTAGDIAKLAARAMNEAAGAEPAAPKVADLAPEVGPAAGFPFKQIRPWDWFAGQAVTGIIAAEGEGIMPAGKVVSRATEIADAMMIERAKREIA